MLHRNTWQVIKDHPFITVFILIMLVLIIMAWWVAGLLMQHIDHDIQKL